MDDNAEQPHPIRPQYEELGADEYYRQFGSEYRNPHETRLREMLQFCSQHWPLDLEHVLDLACGSGEVTLGLSEFATVGGITGCDPFTKDAYLQRTGITARTDTFEEIAAGSLLGQTYSLVACSYAMHLVEPSRLPALTYQLAQITSQLLILSPHKRPVIQPQWGWTLTHEHYHKRVRAKLYKTP